MTQQKEILHATNANKIQMSQGVCELNICSGNIRHHKKNWTLICKGPLFLLNQIFFKFKFFSQKFFWDQHLYLTNIILDPNSESNKDFLVPNVFDQNLFWKKIYMKQKKSFCRPVWTLSLSDLLHKKTKKLWL